MVLMPFLLPSAPLDQQAIPGPGGSVLDDDALEVTVPGRRILVIDDEPAIRRFAARALSSAGFAVDEAAGGHEGLRIALSDPYDLVLLDLRLPDLAGEEVLRHLHQERPHQAVLIWSAAADQQVQRRCLTLGARACLHKPLSLTELLSAIGSAL
jgi:two-component system KDP operon response regulator KdpE